MSSTFAWLDHSESQRRKMLEIIDLFREQGTIDDIGIGTVRDAISDLLFPGTSTLHTRARYFLFIPWIYLDLEQRKVPSGEVAAKARGREVELSKALLRGGESEGVIGREAGTKLKRLPSVQYWSGLGRWGIRVYPGSQERYHRSLDAFYRSTSTDRSEEGSHDRIAINWHPGIPDRPDWMYKQVTFDLSFGEADYLRERIMMQAPGTLLAHLAGTGSTSAVPFPWQHPQFGDFPDDVLAHVDHARNFSEVTYTATALYNRMLAEAVGNDEWAEGFREMFDDARSFIEGRLDELRTWDRRSFWVTVLGINPGIPGGTRDFIDRLIDIVVTAEPDITALRELITYRERVMKGRRARLTNRDALERWSGSSAAFQLDLRWRTVQTVINDILEGLRPAPDGAHA